MEQPNKYSSLIGEITAHLTIETSQTVTWGWADEHDDPNDNYLYCDIDHNGQMGSITLTPATDNQTGEEVALLGLHYPSNDKEFTYDIWASELIDDISKTDFGYKVVFVDCPHDHEEDE